jgi:hypothetical protein
MANTPEAMNLLYSSDIPFNIFNTRMVNLMPFLCYYDRIEKGEKNCYAWTGTYPEENTSILCATDPFRMLFQPHQLKNRNHIHTNTYMHTYTREREALIKTISYSRKEKNILGKWGEINDIHLPVSNQFDVHPMNHMVFLIRISIMCTIHHPKPCKTNPFDRCMQCTESPLDGHAG